MITLKEEIDKTKAIFPRRKRHSLIDWFHKKVPDIYNDFGSLPNAQIVGTEDESFVFVPGTRDDRMVFVAHADTVWGEQELSVGYHCGKYFSCKEKIGIGADDRAGCAMAWKLRDLGHSILIPNCEEKGCIGSRFLSRQKEWSDLINGHRFAIEMDRRGSKDLVFYDVGSSKFTEWCESKFTGYKEARGSFTDIGAICETICGLNISVGYYNEHSGEEILRDYEWNRTLSLLRCVLSQKDLPQFLQDPKPTYEYKPQTSYRKYSYFNHYNDEQHKEPETKQVDYNFSLENLIVCPYCDLLQDISEFKHNKEICVGCQKEL